MSKNLLNYVATLFVTAILLASCQTEIDKFDGDKFVAPGDFGDALKIIQDLDQIATMDAAADHSIWTNNIHIDIPANAWLDENGDPVVGEYQLHLIPVTDAAGLVKYNIHTQTEAGELLEAGGVFFITASQGENSLRMNPAVRIIATMRLVNDWNQVYCSESATEWSDNATEVENGQFVVAHQGEEIMVDGIQFELTRLGWHAAMKPLQVVGMREICLELENSNVPNNTLALFVMSQRLTCLPLNVSNTVGCASSDVPAEAAGKIVVLSHQGEQNEKEIIQFIDGIVQVSLEDENIELRPNFLSREMLVQTVEELAL